MVDRIIVIIAQEHPADSCQIMRQIILVASLQTGFVHRALAFSVLEKNRSES